ncbi:hypothetical protein [Salinarchaeum chitinilyticum]
MGLTIVAAYSLLIGIGALISATQGSLFHAILVPISLAAAYGLWTNSLWGLGAAMLLFIIESVRSGLMALNGDSGAIVTAVLSVLLLLFLYRERTSFQH